MNSSPAGRSFNQSARSRDRSVAFPVRRKGGHEGRIASLNGGSVTPLGKAVITPMTVHNFNNNSNHVDAKSNWQGNRLQCNILEHVNDNALTTGNDLKCNNVNNYYITESSKACNRGNTGAVSNTRISKSSGSNSSRSALTHKRDKKMASHGNEYSTNTGRRMKVQPVGDDQFILTVEDTGISPAILHQQMKDQRVRLPQSQQMSRQQRLYPPNVTPHWTQSYSGGSSSQPFGGQPFMVAMSEGGLPRINMLSTPWLSNTLPHQKVPWTPPQDSELLPVSVSQHQNTFPRVEAADNIDIPVYKIIGNEAVPVRSAVSLPEPPALPPRRSKVRNGSQAESARPVTDSWSLTLPSKSRLASCAPGELEWVGRYHGSPHSVWPTGLDTSSLRQRGMKINAPAAIDVKQVPAAGQSKALVPSSSPNTFNTLPSRKSTNRQEPITSINIQRIDKEVDDMPVFKISTNSPNSASSAANSPNSASSAANSPFPTTSDYDDGNTHLKTNETHPNVLHSTKLAGKSNSSKDTRRKSQRNTRRPETQPAVRLENSDQPPAEKSPSGYLQTYLREVRSPSPSRRKASRERGRQRASRSSSRGRDKNGRFRSPSPMPERCREIIFNDEIDWSNVRAPTPRQIDWDQIAAVLSCGQDIQRLSVVTSLPHLLKDNKDECLRKVIPKIREFLPIAQADMQMAASSVFLQIFQSEVVSGATFAQQFLPIILNALDYKDADVGEAWLDTLLQVIPLLTKDVLRREVMTKAIQKGQLSQNIQSRLMSCRILGKISICLESFVIKKEILPIVQSLCQDVEYEVRACMCRQLDLIAKGLGLESTKSAILPELVELAHDEECSVRLAGLDTVVNILSLLDDETCSSTIIPLVVKFCQSALQEADSTLPVVSRHLGKLCHGLSPNMTAAQKTWFLDYYKKLCCMGRADVSNSDSKSDINDNRASPKTLGLAAQDDDRPVECRVNAAYNFPAMTLFSGSPGKFDTELSSSFSRLCRDPSVPVRKTMAHGFHEVSRTIGSHLSLLLKDLVILFKDEYCQVLNGLVSNMSHTLTTFSKLINPDKQTHAADLLSALLSCEQVIFSSNDWRLQEKFLDNMSVVTLVLSSDQIYSKLVPRTLDKLHNAKALPVRLAAIRALLSYLRCNRKLEQRTEICQQLIADFAEARSYRDRTLFIDICQQVLATFSSSFFRQHFYEAILELSSDPVPNIRLRLCQIMPSLKNTIRLPADRNLLQLLESHVRKLLINERDRDVLAQLKVTVDQLDRIIHESMLSRRNVTEDNLVDQQREAEERLLIEMEEREKREEEAEQAAAGGAKKKGEKKSSNSSSGVSTKSASSKQTLDKKAANSGKASKIPLPPGGKEPRRHSQHTLKSSTPPAVNGVAGPSSAGTARSFVSGRGVKHASSSRNVGSPNSTGSSASINSAGSTRSTGGTTGGSPLSSAGSSTTRRRAELSNDGKKRDSIPTITTLRKASGETINRKGSH